MPSYAVEPSRVPMRAPAIRRIAGYTARATRSMTRSRPSRRLRRSDKRRLRALVKAKGPNRRLRECESGLVARESQAPVSKI